MNAAHSQLFKVFKNFTPRQKDATTAVESRECLNVPCIIRFLKLTSIFLSVSFRSR